MAFLAESLQSKKLKENNIVIRTTYITDRKLAVRTSDYSVNDNVTGGIRCKKEYFLSGKCAHVEQLFDSRMEYTFVSADLENTPFTCPNCGFSGTMKDFLEGCPYCETAPNMEYADKDLGSKYSYDLVLKNPLYRIITAVVDLLVSLFLSGLFIMNTSRTFNGYDIGKIFLFGIILALMLYYLFYICDAYMILGIVKRHKNKQNEKQKNFWKRTNLDKKKVYSALYIAATKKYYAQPEIMDFDILDYTDFQEVRNGKNSENTGLYEGAEETFVNATVQVRLVLLRGNRFLSKYCRDTLTIKNSDTPIKLDAGINVIKCSNCNANLDLSTDSCPYCGTKIRF